MADSFTGEADLFECCICMNAFDDNQHKPKLLPCHHTFCRSCLDSVIRLVDTAKKMSCPLCADKFSVANVDSLKTNLYLEKFKEVLSHQSASPNASLERSESFSTVYTCTKHGNTEKFFWCFKCGVPVCIHCLGIDHNQSQGHNVKDIGEATVEIRRNTDYNMNRMLSQIVSINEKKEQILGLRNTALENATKGLKFGFEAIPRSIKSVNDSLLNPGNQVTTLTSISLNEEDIVSLNKILLKVNNLNDFFTSIGNIISQKYVEEKILSKSSIMVSAIKSKIKFDYGRIYCMRCGEMCDLPKKISAQQSPYCVDVIEHRCKKCNIMVAQFY